MEEAVRVLVTVLAAGIGRLPPSLAAWIGRRLGDVGYIAFRGRRRLGLANLGQAFPAMPAAERRSLYRRACQHLGLVLVELCGLLTRPLERILPTISLEGRQHVDRVMAEHGRALVLSAHLGNWEILSVAHRLAPYPLAVVVRPLDSPGLNLLAERLRRKTGVELIDKRFALRPVLAALDRGGLVGILLDQNAARNEGVFVPFFGRPASTSRAIAVLAVRTGAPVLPIFTRRETGARHRVIIGRPVPPPQAKDREEAIRELTARCTTIIESAIRECPEQWLWMHRRWRTRPAEPR